MDEAKMYGCIIRYIFCMCFLLRFKQPLVLGNKQVDTTDKEAYDEQKELQQALFLVELLKSEYARVLRENKEMKSNRGLREGGAVTCATTEKGKFERTPITPQAQHWPRRIPPIFPALRKWRRRFPQIDSNIYYDIPAGNNEYEGYDEQKNAGGWRRFQYEDAFGPQPGGSTNTSSTTKTAAPSSPKASSVMSSAPTSTPSTENDNILTVSSSSHVASKTTISEITTSVTAKPKSETTKETVTTSLTSASHTTRRIMLLLSKKTSTVTSNVANAAHSVPSTKLNVLKNVTTSDNDLEVSQAAAEFEKELGSNLGNWKKRRSRKLPKIWRASTRVHLAGSTRYQIPLPENHAFCYTNPDNALCRTFI